MSVIYLALTAVVIGLGMILLLKIFENTGKK